MPKPASTAPWATDTNYTGGPEHGTPTKVAPSASKQAEGWEPGEEPPAQCANHWQNLVGQWIDYLAAGIFEGDVTIDGGLTVEGVTVLKDTVDIQSALSVLTDITAGTDVIAAGDVYFSLQRTLRISAASARGTGSATYNGRWSVPDSSSPVIYPIDLTTRDRIKGFTLFVNKSSNASVTLSAQIFKRTTTGTLTAVGSAASSSANAPGATFLQLSGLDVEIGDSDSDASYELIVSVTGASGDLTGNAQIDFNRAP